MPSLLYRKKSEYKYWAAEKRFAEHYKIVPGCSLYYPGQKNWDRHARQTTGAFMLETHAPVPAGAWLSQFFWPG